MIERFAVAAVSLVFVGCSRPRAAELTPVGADPVITRLDPQSGPAGVAYPIRVTIEGHGFEPLANTVTFGPAEVSQVPSTGGGTRIVFFVPKEMPSRGEVPPAPLLPESYEVTVTTAHGTSRPAVFTLTAEPGSRR